MDLLIIRQGEMSQSDSLGGRYISERNSGKRENERQFLMARLAAQCRHTNVIKLVTLRKGNHPGEA